MQVFLHGGRSLIILENPFGRSLTILENLRRGLYWILKTSLSPKDQRELFIPFSKASYSTIVIMRNRLPHSQLCSNLKYSIESFQISCTFSFSFQVVCYNHSNNNSRLFALELRSYIVVTSTLSGKS